MIAYKDRTFCPFWVLCKEGYKCKRALTEEIRKAAEKAKLGICQFSEQPDCFTALWEMKLRQ